MTQETHFINGRPTILYRSVEDGYKQLWEDYDCTIPYVEPGSVFKVNIYPTIRKIGICVGNLLTLFGIWVVLDWVRKLVTLFYPVSSPSVKVFWWTFPTLGVWLVLFLWLNSIQRQKGK